MAVIVARGNPAYAGGMRSILHALATVLFLPFVVVPEALREQRTLLRKTIVGILVLVLSLPIWLFLLFCLGIILYRISTPLLIQSGLQKIEVGIVGTGSMFPTFPLGSGKTEEEKERQTVARPQMRLFPSGITVLGRTYFEYDLQFRDIVSFRSPLLDSISLSSQSGSLVTDGYVKRLIGLPGDLIELRDGFVFRNGELLLEPYTAAPRSTFGGESIAECKPTRIPEDSVLVLGDNRKASNDSRYTLGLLPVTQIEHVLPWTEQELLYSNLWRDASRDAETANKTEFNETTFIRLLNEFRKENNRKEYRLQPKLKQSAESRGKLMLQFDDFSFAATKSGQPMRKVLEKLGYSNIVYGEAPILGYYTAEEFMQYLRAQPRWREYLTNPDFQEIGVASFIGELRGCPTQIMVLHLAGYKPAEYPPDVLDSWKQAVSASTASLESWKKGREAGSWYDANKAEVERLIQMIEERQRIALAIYEKMSKREWLNNQDNTAIARYETLSRESTELSRKLNAGE